MWILKLPSLKAFRSFSSILMHLAPWNFNGLPLSNAALGQIYSMHLKRLKNLDTQVFFGRKRSYSNFKHFTRRTHCKIASVFVLILLLTQLTKS